MDITTRLNGILVSLFNSVLKMEEAALKNSSRHNLSMTEIHTLDAIGIGKGKTMTQVATTLRISISTLTTAIDKLVQKGYVERRRVPEDRRIVRIELTEEGENAVKEHTEFHQKMVNDAISDLDDEKKNILVKSLDNINDFFQVQRIRKTNPVRQKMLSPIMIGDLRLPVPIFQGGMGIGVSLNRLAAAVAIEGGVGVISAANPGFLEPDFRTNPKEANIRALGRQIRAAVEAIKDIPNRGLIGVNIMCAIQQYEDMVKTAVEAGADLIISGAGLPTHLPALVKDSKIKLIPIVSSARAAAVIIKSWAKKYDRAPDAVIFEGPDAGGHLGFKKDQIEDAQKNFYQTLAEIKEEIQNIPNCPLIAAGGIYSREDIDKALTYGADGVQLGTRFVTTEECDADMKFKEAYLNATEEDVTIVSSPVGMPGRALRNEFVKRIEAERLAPKRCNNCLVTCDPKTTPYCITDALMEAAKGNVENGLIFCGSNAWKADKITTVKEIFKELQGEVQ